ncbi:MAG: peptide-methionine (R)-S-oxide reductase MsrB [Chthoniobacterales bacterium]|jgi:peptide methionine sulfoxide reductase msrA/msrB
MYGGRITSEEKSSLSMYVGLALVAVLGAGAIYLFMATQETKPLVGFDPNQAVQSDAVLKQRLKPEEYRIVRGNGTQTPFQNEFWDNDKPGIYVDVITNEPLFSSADKYDGGVGLPTFSKPISKDLIVEVADNSHDMQRTEVRAKRSNAHLGHLFPDPKSPTGQAYTVNSAAFHFIPVEQMKAQHYDAYLPLVEKKP